MSPTDLDEINVPEEFLCPISLSLMRHPVMSKDGKNFEKAAILDWLNRGNVACPLTRKPLKPSLLAPNNNLKARIYCWKKENGILDDNNDEDAEKGFVGVLHVMDQFSDMKGNLQYGNPDDALLTPRVGDDDLEDILNLYNEVLDMANASSPAEYLRSVPGDTLATRSMVNLAANSTKRRWRPKFFGKKIRTSS